MEKKMRKPLTIWSFSKNTRRRQINRYINRFYGGYAYTDKHGVFHTAKREVKE